MGGYDLSAVPSKKSHSSDSSSETSSTSSASDDNEEKRQNWGGQLEFILTIVGFAVGLGNVWRFPYLCYKNGGGAFLIPYFIMLAIVGMPLFFLELSLGQFASLGPIAVWTLNPAFKGLGVAMSTTNILVGIYYNVIVAWALYYFFASMNSVVPWATCDNVWNTENCVTGAPGNNTTILANESKTASEEYYYRNVLQLSDGISEQGTIVWQLALCLFLAWTIIYFVLIKGIASLGKVVYFSTIFPYILLTVMLIRGVTLEGAGEGISYYLNPDINRLSDARVWSDAATQIFYSLSTCTGGMIAMASYNKFNNNCLRDSIMVPLINCLTSFYAGFVVFSVLGYMSVQKNVPVSEVAVSGPGLVFVVYPEGLTTMPGSPVWSVLFFLMMATLGFSSMFSIVEGFFAAVTDELPFVKKSRIRTIIFRACSVLVFFGIGLSMVTQGGFYVFNIFEVYIGGFPLLIIGLFEILTVIYIYGFRKFSYDIQLMLGRKPYFYFSFYYIACWVIITPVALMLTIVTLALQYQSPTLFSGPETYYYPTWAEGIGWAIVCIALIGIPLGFILTFCVRGGFKVLIEANKPTEEWGPALAKDCTGKYETKTVHRRKINMADRIVIHSIDVPQYDNLATSFESNTHIAVS